MRRASLGLIAATAALILALVAATLSIVAVTRNHSQSVMLSTTSDKRTITVSGTGIATIAPDIARFSVGVQEQGTNLTEVQGTVAQKTDTIIAALVKSGLDRNKDLQTSGYSVQPIYDYPKEKAPVVSGYRVANTINATVRALDKDPNKVGPVIDAAVQAGANNIGGITFTLSDPQKAGAIARDAAMKNAQAKADALAQAGGAKLGIVLIVSDQSVTPGAPREVQNYPAATTAAGSAAIAPPTAIISGDTNVTVTINVAFSLQ